MVGGVRGTSVSVSPPASRPSQSPVEAVNVAMAIEHLAPLPTRLFSPEDRSPAPARTEGGSLAAISSLLPCLKGKKLIADDSLLKGKKITLENGLTFGLLKRVCICSNVKCIFVKL